MVMAFDAEKYIYDSRTESVAVPIRIGSRVLGTIGIVGIASAVTGQDLADRHLTPLMAARDKLEAEVKTLKI